MTVEEIIHKVKALEIRSKKLTNRLLSGEYHSAFKGRGMLFKEVREYYPGDDIRFIDWNVSARFGHPFSKVFEEERERTVLLLLDLSGSLTIGTRQRTKAELLIEIAAVLAFSALNNNDKTGAILFTDRVEKYIPPRKGRQHLLYMVRNLLSHQPQSNATDIGAALKFVQKTTRHQTILFLISDFAGEGYENLLRSVSARHDAIAVHLKDPADDLLPDAGLIPLEDAETGTIQWVDSSDKTQKALWQKIMERKTMFTQQMLRQAGWSYMLCNTTDDYVANLQQFFTHRMK